jgi:hypothetical protein
VTLKLPANAHVDSSGNDWDCDQSYFKQGNKCALRQ